MILTINPEHKSRVDYKSDTHQRQVNCRHGGVWTRAMQNALNYRRISGRAAPVIDQMTDDDTNEISAVLRPAPFSLQCARPASKWMLSVVRPFVATTRRNGRHILPGTTGCMPGVPKSTHTSVAHEYDACVPVKSLVRCCRSNISSFCTESPASVPMPGASFRLN